MRPQINQSDVMRHRLQNILVERCQKNPSYSLRAFARTLKIEPSALSKILAGKRAITCTMFERFSEKLGFEPAEKALILAPQPNQTAPYSPVDADVFHLIADWYHYAILQLIGIDGFEPNAKWIAKKLGLTVAEVNVAIERLVRLNLLKVDGKRWQDLGSLSTIGSPFSSIAFRKLQRQILLKAIDALEEVPVNERDQSSMTMAIDSTLLPKAKEKIKKFRRQLDRFLQSGKRKDQVYHLSVSLYPVTRNLKKRDPS